MAFERTTLNLRGYCLYCLGKICDSNQSPAGSPASSSLRSPLTRRHYNVHSLCTEERLAPFTVLCHYLGVDFPDNYAFGDGIEPDMLTPPLCKKCLEVTARLCFLQDELQHIQGKINNTVKRIHERILSTAGSQRGALKREAFQREFKRKSKGSLSRGRAENVETRKVTEMLKHFHMKIIARDTELAQGRSYDVTMTSLEQLNPDPAYPLEMYISQSEENDENENAISMHEINEYMPTDDLLSETGRLCKDLNSPVMELDQIKVNVTKPGSELTTILCPHEEVTNSIDNVGMHDGNEIGRLIAEQVESTRENIPASDFGVTTRSRAKRSRVNK